LIRIHAVEFLGRSISNAGNDSDKSSFSFSGNIKIVFEFAKLDSLLRIKFLCWKILGQHFLLNHCKKIYDVNDNFTCNIISDKNFTKSSMINVIYLLTLRSFYSSLIYMSKAQVERTKKVLSHNFILLHIYIQVWYNLLFITIFYVYHIFLSLFISIAYPCWKF